MDPRLGTPGQTEMKAKHEQFSSILQRSDTTIGYHVLSTRPMPGVLWSLGHAFMDSAARR